MTNSHARMIGKSAERLTAGAPRKPRLQRPGKREGAVFRLAGHSTQASSPGPVSPSGAAFAGSKWGESPAPTALPRPPTHWTGSARLEPDFARGLKMLLNMQA